MEMQGRNLPDSLLFIVPIAISLLFSRVLFSIPHVPGQASLHILTYAGTALFAALLFVPVGAKNSLESLLALSKNCAMIVLVFMIAVLLDSQTRGAISRIMPLALILFLLTVVALAPVLRFSSVSTHIRQIVFVVLAVLFAVPVWLGPLAEQSGHLPLLPNLLVGVSPLSALAVSLDLDYLRSNWFYQHSVLGSLRYEYVAWPAYLLFLSATVGGIVFSAARRGVGRESINRNVNQIGNGVTNS